MQTFRFSANKFSNMDELTFSARKYSRLKHGSESVTIEFGNQLAEALLNSPFLNELEKAIEGRKMIITGAPFKYIPAASTALKNAFLSRFNPAWAMSGHDSIQDFKIIRGQSYNRDYGSMTQDERELAMEGEFYSIDKDFIQNKVIISIDDVRITGSHERKVETILKNAGFDGIVVHVYYAELIGDAHPKIENELNYNFVQGIEDIDTIIQEDGFIINTRVTKLILKSDPDKFKTFLETKSPKFKQCLMDCLIGNEYHKLEEFQENVAYLHTENTVERLTVLV